MIIANKGHQGLTKKDLATLAKMLCRHISSSNKGAENIGSTGVSMVGSTVFGASRDGKAAIDELRNWRDRRNANRSLPPGGSKY